MTAPANIKQAVAWVALSGTLLGGAFFAEDRFANAQETKAAIVEQSFRLLNSQEALANTNRLERLQRELRSIQLRRANGTQYPGDGALIQDLNEEIRNAREYRSELRQKAIK